MSYITTKDGRQIYYKDWGKGPVVTFSHGWPLSSDAWDGQMLFIAQRGFRVVAHEWVNSHLLEFLQQGQPTARKAVST